MIVGIPKEIKDNEYRVALTPAGAGQLCNAGHAVLIEKSAGIGSGITDDDYRACDAKIQPSPESVYERSELIVKVKEPLEPERPRIRPDHVIFTYFHFAASRELTLAMIASGAACVAYETVELADGTLPLLTPMSEVAGRMAVQEGAKYLERPMEGRGILLSGVAGVLPANVLILGAGVVGANAARIAAGIGANVTVMDIDLDRLRYLEDVMPANVTTLHSNPHTIREKLAEADLVIGAVLLVGAKSPVLVTRDMLKLMKRGAVIVDVAVDQGGCFETTGPTTHKDPTYVVDGVVHYCVSNMPGAVAGTSTYALTNATFPYVQELADKGLERAVRENPALMAGLNIAHGKLLVKDLADEFGVEYVPKETQQGWTG